MIHTEYPIQVEGSQPYAKLVTYLQDDSDSMLIDARPLILICPGGGYEYTSDREAEPIALAFLAMGYHAAVLRYSCAPSRYPTALLELAKSVALIRENAAQWHVDADKIVVQGSSAGGHLAASLGMFWDEDFVAEGIGLGTKVGCGTDAGHGIIEYGTGHGVPTHDLLKPNGMLLCYPVITSGEYAHRGSFECLLGEREAELAAKVSLENQVTDKTPEAFIWCTFEDGCVPMENSLFLVSAMRKANIPVEFHLYPHGGHGLALANHLTQHTDGSSVQEECTSWVGLAATWLKRRFAVIPF